MIDERQRRSSMAMMKVVAGYVLHERLGSGSFATVYKGSKIAPNSVEGADMVAVKAIDRKSKNLTKKALQNLEMEISILRTYRHRNIVYLQNVQKTERHFYLLLEYCAGGDVQKFIRSRKTGRLTERLTRRLMRDLSSGLKFLWGQQLIHRDIKPQNLLLTGPLPLDECNDPERTQDLETKRKEIDFPTKDFTLKIADFGFARHLQTASLAETLCGSPLYMAPEILQHQRYDAKADLWSVGAVLFEMIAGHPPFNGENHMDLLRNIQRKAVRLPIDVKVSKECVNLLRLMLNRNPVSRAGFNEFFDACDAFVALGCSAGLAEYTEVFRKSTASTDLKTIHENDAAMACTESITAVQTITNQPRQEQQKTVLVIPDTAQTIQQRMQQSIQKPYSHDNQQPKPVKAKAIAPSLPFGYFATPTVLGAKPPGKLSGADSSKFQVECGGLETNLQSIPFQDSRQVANSPAAIQLSHWQCQKQSDQLFSSERKNNLSLLHCSSDGSSFVMVERSSLPQTNTSNISLTHHNKSFSVEDTKIKTQCSIPRSSNYSLNTNPMEKTRVGKSKGANFDTFEMKMGEATQNLVAAEDVGRRVVCVTHLGDNRAFFALRPSFANGNNSSLLSVSPMESVEEENAIFDVQSMSSAGRVSTSIDKTMTDAEVIEEEDDTGEILFAINPNASSVPITNNTASSSSTLIKGISFKQGGTHDSRGTNISGSQHVKFFTASVILSCFNEALLCYVKALNMLKGSLSTLDGVERNLHLILMEISGTQSDQRDRIKQIRNRCVSIAGFLSQQFHRVLERADACKAEISKISKSQLLATQQQENNGNAATCVEKLIYKNSLSTGREGAVKQLLGQNEAARSCYRSAGLLIETLLMETVNLDLDDRKTLEGYLDGFAARITDMDQFFLQQQSGLGENRVTTISAEDDYSLNIRPGSSVIGLIGDHSITQ